MNIILGKANAEILGEKYVVLELDTFRLPGATDPVTAYCVTEDMPLQELLQLNQWRELHQKLMENYRKKNWQYCQTAIDHLRGKWSGQLDSFYDELCSRIMTYQKNPVTDSWDGIIDRV